jgi:hypothetical protein
MPRHRRPIVGPAGCALAAAGVFAVAVAGSVRQAEGEQERAVTEAQVPNAALEALKRLAGKAAITAFAEEIEHGHMFYEGSWAGAAGNVDALVTASGDLVEIEETVPADRVPPAVRAEIDKAADRGAAVTWEKKTLIMYEAHFRRADRAQELILTPDGRRHLEEGGDGPVDEGGGEDG